MLRRAVDSERRRINWGDLLDEAWGKDEPLAQHATLAVSDVRPTCDEDSPQDQDKENTDTNQVPKQTRTAANVGGDSKITTDSGVFPRGELFPEISKCSKPTAPRTNRTRKRLAARDNGKLVVRNVPRSRSSRTKLQLKRPGASTTTTTTTNSKTREHLHQLCLDLGQKSFGHVTCRVCGMIYSLGHTQDETDHARFHRRYLAGVSFHGWKHERVAEEFFDGRILVVFPGDRRNHLRKVQELCSLVDSELGLAAGVSPWRPTTKMYLYVSTAKKVMGCVFAERISEGYPVLGSSSPAHSLQNSTSTTSSSMTSLSTMSLSVTSSSLLSETHQLDLQSAWYCSSAPRPAVVGVNRVWVSQQHRRTGVASRILDTIRFNFIPGSIISKDQLAFSDPTPSGKAFAAAYCGTENFLVYHWNF